MGENYIDRNELNRCRVLAVGQVIVTLELIASRLNKKKPWREPKKPRRFTLTTNYWNSPACGWRKEGGA